MNAIGHLTVRDLCVISNDGEPRLLDRRLAGRLGYSRPEKIRELIERYRDELEDLGNLPHRRVNLPGGAGRPANEYWLLETQALIICMRSDAKQARAVRKEVAEAFFAFRRGEHPATPLTHALLAPLPTVEVKRDANVLRVKHEDWRTPAQPDLFGQWWKSEDTFKQVQRDPTRNLLVREEFWWDTPQIGYGRDGRLQEVEEWFEEVGPDGRLWNEWRQMETNYWRERWTREEWFGLPLELRRRWWMKTNYNKMPPDAELLRDVAHAIAIEFEE